MEYLPSAPVVYEGSPARVRATPAVGGYAVTTIPSSGSPVPVTVTLPVIQPGPFSVALILVQLPPAAISIGLAVSSVALLRCHSGTHGAAGSSSWKYSLRVAGSE